MYHAPPPPARRGISRCAFVRTLAGLTDSASKPDDPRVLMEEQDRADAPSGALAMTPATATPRRRAGRSHHSSPRRHSASSLGRCQPDRFIVAGRESGADGSLLVFAGRYGDGISHGAISVGNGLLIHAEHARIGVCAGSPFGEFFAAHDDAARRLS